MPRKARKNLKMSFLHVMTQGINKEYIFNTECEIKKYLELLEQNSKKFNIKIIAYCIMNNHAHLLVYTEQIKDISEFMRRVNTIYAMYYNKKKNRCGYVFRNRYRAEEIYTEKHLISCINYIHNNPVKAGICKEKKNYKYSSYNDYVNKKRFVNDELIANYLECNGINYRNVINSNFECYNFIEYEIKKERKENKEKIISNFIQTNNMELEKLINDRDKLKNLVIQLYEECNMTQKEIAERLGINRSKVQRLTK